MRDPSPRIDRGLSAEYQYLQYSWEKALRTWRGVYKLKVFTQKKMSDRDERSSNDLFYDRSIVSMSRIYEEAFCISKQSIVSHNPQAPATQHNTKISQCLQVWACQRVYCSFQTWRCTLALCKASPWIVGIGLYLWLTPTWFVSARWKPTQHSLSLSVWCERRLESRPHGMSVLTDALGLTVTFCPSVREEERRSGARKRRLWA